MKTLSRNTSEHKVVNFLMTMRDRIDKEISLLGPSHKKDQRKIQGSKGSYGKKNVSGKKNGYTLEEAILQVLTPKRAKRTQQVVDAIENKKLYKSKSDSIYTMVNIRLNSLAKEGRIEKEGRGDFKASETPKESSPKKKRGRPRKNVEENSEIDTTKVA